MNYQVTHATTYNYSAAVSLCQNLTHLTPRPYLYQLCHDSRLEIRPQPALVTELTDFFGNPASFFAVQEPHRQLQVIARHTLEVLPRSPEANARTRPWEEVRELLRSNRADSHLQAYHFVFGSRYARPAAELADYALFSFTPHRPILEAALDLTERIHNDFQYDPRATTVATPLKEVFTKRRGVCQDFAHLQIACMRSLGLAARYVSGYLCTKPPPGQRRLTGADATHAWIAAYCGDVGWIDLDATNNVIPADQHLLLAWGRDYDDVSPVKGVILGGGRHRVSVGVDVIPEDELVEA